MSMRWGRPCRSSACCPVKRCLAHRCRAMSGKRPLSNQAPRCASSWPGTCSPAKPPSPAWRGSWASWWTKATLPTATGQTSPRTRRTRLPPRPATASPTPTCSWRWRGSQGWTRAFRSSMCRPASMRIWGCCYATPTSTCWWPMARCAASHAAMSPSTSTPSTPRTTQSAWSPTPMRGPSTTTTYRWSAGAMATGAMPSPT